MSNSKKSLKLNYSKIKLTLILKDWLAVESILPINLGSHDALFMVFANNALKRKLGKKKITKMKRKNAKNEGKIG